jgi:hypothetical protein
MGICFDVRVLDDEGEPVSSTEVTALFPSLPIGEVSIEEYTDSEGHVSFDTEAEHHKQVRLVVEGKSFGPYELEDGAEFTVTLS